MSEGRTRGVSADIEQHELVGQCIVFETFCPNGPVKKGPGMMAWTASWACSANPYE